jgi:hypothetical protein
MSDLHAVIEAELRRHEKISLRPDQMRMIVDQIVRVGTSRAPADARPVSFQKNTQARARRELDEAAELTDELIRKIKNLHQPAIVALADRGAMVATRIEPFLTAR